MRTQNFLSDSIEHARKVALSILQPTPSQLEYGLELHRNSLVIDSYGFAPRADVDDEVLAEAAQNGATAYEIEELSGEMAMLGMADNEAYKSTFIQAFEAAGVTCIFQNAGEENNNIETLLRRFGRFTYAADAMPDVLRRATDPRDILAARAEGKRCLYLSTNGVPLPGRFRNTTEAIEFIRTFFQLGARMMHLTYNRRNLIGDGCGESTDGGLSEFGRAVVEEMNRVGVIADIAHCGIQTGLDAARCSEKPVVISHAPCAALSDHCRAKTDELIRAVADGAGLIGIVCLPSMLQGSGDINALLDHIDHVVQLAGFDYVAIGTDRSAPTYERRARPADFPRSRTRFESLWPARDANVDRQWSKPEQNESLSWTNWPLFTVGMVQRGYSEANIQKVLGGNMLRVAQAALH
jgi:membrane dipeptidase